MSTTESLQTQLDQFRTEFAALRRQIAETVVGQEQAIETTLIALLAGGHVLLESRPGLGKTRLARTLAAALDLDFRRIQFTADLMPADITGTYVVLESHGQRKFDFQRGPIFTQVLLADEINRALRRKRKRHCWKGWKSGSSRWPTRTTICRGRSSSLPHKVQRKQTGLSRCRKRNWTGSSSS